MSELLAQPQFIAAAATHVGEIESAIDAAKAAAAGPTTSVLAAASDEVSALTAEAFGAYGQQYQAILKQAAAFHSSFLQALNSAGAAYTGAETAASNALGTLGADVQAMLGGNAAPVAATVAGTAGLMAPAPLVDKITTLVLGASGLPIPPPQYISGIPPLYIDGPWGAGINIGISTPEGLYPLTGIKDLTFDISAARGLTILDNAIHTAFNTGSTQVNIFGYSQSAVIASLEMHALNPFNMPGGSPLNLNFTLVGDPSNPNGGLLTRFPGLSLPSLGLSLFGTATPDNSFPTHIYTIQYDGFGDFPQYPIDFLSDVNAFLGIIELHGQYPFLTPLQISTATQLTTLGTPLSHYYIVDTGKFPLTDFIRDIPLVGNPVADLVEPDLKVLVDLGYGSTDVGYSTTPANVPTPFGVLPPVSPLQVFGALAAGTQQGVSAFAADLHTMLASPSSVSLSGLTSTLQSVGTHVSSQLSVGATGLTTALSSPTNFLAALQTATNDFSTAVTSSASTAYATLLPTADVVTALATSMPSYDLNLFLNGVEQVIDGDPVGGIVNALGGPFAADTALLTLFGGFEFRVFQHAVTSIAGNFSIGTPAPTDTVTL